MTAPCRFRLFLQIIEEGWAGEGINSWAHWQNWKSTAKFPRERHQDYLEEQEERLEDHT